MTLTQAMQILGIAEGQQISDEVAEAIRTVLAEMQKRVEVVRRGDCEHLNEYKQVDGSAWCFQNTVYKTPNGYCDHGERREKENTNE